MNPFNIEINLYYGPTHPSIQRAEGLFPREEAAGP